MISTRENSKLLEILRRLIKAYRPEKIYLFGSQARGQMGPDSDFDLMVVVPNDASAERRRSRLAYEELWGLGTAADVLVCTQSYFQSRLQVPSSLPAVVTREGRLVYAD